MGLHVPNAGGQGSIPGWGTGSRVPATTESLHAPTKAPKLQPRPCTTIYIYIYIYIKDGSKSTYTWLVERTISEQH